MTPTTKWSRRGLQKNGINLHIIIKILTEFLDKRSTYEISHMINIPMASHICTLLDMSLLPSHGKVRPFSCDLAWMKVPSEPAMDVSDRDTDRELRWDRYNFAAM
jgi:hypothetical protein